MQTEVQAPVAKSVTALGAGVGSAGYASLNGHLQNFLPVDLIGWVSLAAAFMGLVYTMCILTEWWWKKVWKPLFIHLGWIKPRGHVDSTFDLA